MNKIQKLKLLGLSTIKVIFTIISFPITIILGLIDIILYLISFRKIDWNLCSLSCDFCIGVYKKILDKEFKVIFNK